jgi:hypothetical protein
VRGLMRVHETTWVVPRGFRASEACRPGPQPGPLSDADFGENEPIGV